MAYQAFTHRIWWVMVCYDLAHQIRCAKHTVSGWCDIPPMVCCSFGGHSTPQFLQCVFRGNPKFYTFRWLHVESHTLLSTTATSDSWGSLHLPSVQWSDVGTYECSVENSAGISKANISISFGSKYEILLCNFQIYFLFLTIILL